MLGMSRGAGVDGCANCGAPLELDEAGRCRWCHAHVQQRRPNLAVVHYSFDDQVSLVPANADDCMTSAPFLFLTLSTLGPALSIEPAVQEYTRHQPGLHAKIRALSTAVSAAGVRVRDDGLLKDDFDDNLKVYTPEEIWLFDLAIDVIAMLGTLGGLPKAKHAQVASNLRSLDQSVDTHTWKKELKKAGAGPAEFRELRAGLPRHTPSPGR